MERMCLKNNIFLFFCLFCITTLFSQHEALPPLTIVAPKSYEKNLVPEIQTTYAQACRDIEKVLGLPTISQVRIAISADKEEINNSAGYNVPSWVLGMAFPARNFILINARNLGLLANRLNSVVTHEVCHLYLGEWERENGLVFPQWFNEGVCEWISGRLHLDHSTQIFEGVIANKIIPFSELDKKFPEEAERVSMAYIQSRDMIEYMVKKYGRDSISSIIQTFATTKDFTGAIEKVTTVSFAQIENDWLLSITPKYKWFWQIAQFFSLFTIMSFLVIWAYLRQRNRKRHVLEKWEQEERQIYEDTGH